METSNAICAFCGFSIAERNPSGRCDHLYWPDYLTDEAKRANGYTADGRRVQVDDGNVADLEGW
jgi:hypothetical protein